MLGGLGLRSGTPACASSSMVLPPSAGAPMPARFASSTCKHGRCCLIGKSCKDYPYFAGNKPHLTQLGSSSMMCALKAIISQCSRTH